jgi:6-pyruvoyltetrahydropterin/6-carboxytetrahydropterin synthase
MYYLRIKQHFDSAHKLNDYDGECANLHGHRWIAEVCLSFDTLQDNGIAIDFKVIKDKLKEILPDHRYLNDIMKENPTAENIAKWIYKRLPSKCQSVTIWETPECSVTYTEESNA